MAEGFCGSCGMMTETVTVDFGIGSYEYWGAPGNDVREAEVSKCCEDTTYRLRVPISRKGHEVFDQLAFSDDTEDIVDRMLEREFLTPNDFHFADEINYDLGPDLFGDEVI